MRKTMKFKNIILFLSLAAAVPSVAETVNTGRGKLLSVEGHQVANCKTVIFKGDSSGEKGFRIKDNQGSKGIMSVALAALLSNREVVIFYSPESTTGCGSEPAISYLRIY